MRAARVLAGPLFVFVFAQNIIGSAPTAAAPVHYLDAAPLAVVGSAPIKTAPGSNAYGWTWDHPVAVYDGTGNPRWDVAGAVGKWSLYGLRLHLTSNAAAADVTVTQGDANALCATTAAVIGCTDTTVTGGRPVHSVVVMARQYAGWPYWQTLAGGMLHELGHAVGFGHAPAPMSNADSVMGVPIPLGCCARTRLSSYDRGGVRLAY